MSQKELDELIRAEEERLGVGSPEFMACHNEIMEEAEQIQKREQARKEAKKNMKELKAILNQLDVHGYFATRTYEHIIIVYLDQEYFGTYNTKSKSFIDLDISRLGSGRSEKVG